ncbi:MAG: hypothetical protein ACF8XB_05585 [Planctomycetota bacterium JB042]
MLPTAVAAALLLFVDPPCQTDLGFQGPGTATLSICGDLLDGPGAAATLSIANATPSTPQMLVVGLQNAPTPVSGGMLVPFPPAFTITGPVTDGAGSLALPVAGVAAAAVPVYVQSVGLLPAPEFTNALEVIVGETSLPHAESFDGPDGADWPFPWTPVATGLIDVDLQGGRARFSASPNVVGRVVLPGFSAVDVDVTVTVEFETFFDQGFGFYARQNGGWLHHTWPVGEGYAVFLHGDWPGYGPSTLGLWRERNGVEELLATQTSPFGAGAGGTRYRIRFQVEQTSPTTTTLRAKTWLEGAAEPPAWGVVVTDSTPSLQNVAGSFAADVYNWHGSARAWMDDLSITTLP